jgi:hypothetical protein
MVPGYVQGGTRPPPECPEGSFRVVLYSGNLWILTVLVHEGGWERNGQNAVGGILFLPEKIACC